MCATVNWVGKWEPIYPRWTKNKLGAINTGLNYSCAFFSCRHLQIECTMTQFTREWFAQISKGLNEVLCTRNEAQGGITTAISMWRTAVGFREPHLLYEPVTPPSPHVNSVYEHQSNLTSLMVNRKYCTVWRKKTLKHIHRFGKL